MFRQLKYFFCFNKLATCDNTIKRIQIYSECEIKQRPQLFNFSNQVKPSLWSRIFPGASNHLSLLQLYIQFMIKRENKPLQLAYEYIEYNLRRKVLDELFQSKVYLTDYKLKIISSELIEKIQMTGLFIERKYNLDFNSYQLQTKRPDFLVYKLKKSLRSDAVRIYERIVRQYIKEKRENKYGKNIQQYCKQGVIYRYIYEMVLDLQISLKSQLDGKSSILGKEGPFSHLIQIESYFDHVSGIEQFYLTDVDFMLKGNPHFRASLSK